MADGGTTEIIWHFAGYLRLFEADPVSRSTYNPFDHAMRSADYSAESMRDALPKADLPEFASKPLKFSLPSAPAKSIEAQTVPTVEAKIEVVAPIQGSSIINEAFSFHSLASAFSNGVAVRGGGDSFTSQPPQLPYGISYEDGGNNKIVSAVQANLIDDDDELAITSGADLSEMHTVDVPAVLLELLDKAHAYTPQDLAPETDTPLHWKNLVEVRDAALEREQGGNNLDEGIYVNGEAVSGKPSNPPLRPGPPENGEAGSQVMETGSNKALNTAVIADLNEATGTLIVLGDYYETNAIIQANICSDNDQVLPGSANAASAATGDNLALNIATLVAEEVAGRRGDGISPEGINVNITFAEGDLFDVKSLSQRNWISDNDEAIQTTSEAFSATYVGANQQANAARFVDLASYDVIIVLGDYHDFNMVSQTNILLDDDILGATGGGSGVGHADLHGGRNHLVNEASIENYGASGFKDVTDDLEDLIATIGGRGTPTLNDWSSFAGSASGQLDVLVVRGDYWDINVISQTNVIVDADVGLQHLANGGGSQWMSTGGNDAQNVAKIIDFGSVFDQYLGGEHYSDAVMIQAEYIDASASVVNNDTMALISEAVAFAGLLDQPMGNDSPDTIPSHSHNDDIMGAVLT